MKSVFVYSSNHTDRFTKGMLSTLRDVPVFREHEASGYSPCTLLSLVVRGPF